MAAPQRREHPTSWFLRQPAQSTIITWGRYAPQHLLIIVVGVILSRSEPAREVAAATGSAGRWEDVVIATVVPGVVAGLCPGRHGEQGQEGYGDAYKQFHAGRLRHPSLTKRLRRRLRNEPSAPKEDAANRQSRQRPDHDIEPLEIGHGMNRRAAQANTLPNMATPIGRMTKANHS